MSEAYFTFCQRIEFVFILQFGCDLIAVVFEELGSSNELVRSEVACCCPRVAVGFDWHRELE